MLKINSRGVRPRPNDAGKEPVNRAGTKNSYHEEPEEHEVNSRKKAREGTKIIATVSRHAGRDARSDPWLK